jgi:SNF2 family DNA or RNA helicase
MTMLSQILSATAPMAAPTADRAHLQVLTAERKDQILRLIPGAQVLGETAVGPVLQVPWTQAACETLGGLRAPVVPRILADYDWPSVQPNFRPMPQQYKMAGWMSVWRRGFVLGDPGVGKTLSALWAADYLLRTRRVQRVLVVTMRSIMRPAWLSDVVDHLRHIDRTVVYSTDARRRKTLARQPTTLHITSYQTAETCHHELMSNKYDLVIADESTQIKNTSTDRWKYLYPIVAQARYAWELTGTATAHAPTDAHGQIKLLYGERWNVSADAFQKATMIRVSEYRWVPRADAKEVVHQAMQPAITIHKRDVMKWMPETTRRDLEVDLSKAQAGLIKSLQDEARVVLDSGVRITSVHAAALRTKLLQIACGVILDENQKPHEIDNKPRMDELLRLIAEARAVDDDYSKAPMNKVLVLCPFVAAVERVSADVRKAGFKAIAVHGGVPLTQRNAWLDKRTFNETRDVEVVVAVPQVMSHGLNLYAANLTVWYSPTDSNEVVMQAEERMARPGQKNPMHIVRLSATGAERSIYARTDERTRDYADFRAMYADMVRGL